VTSYDDICQRKEGEAGRGSKKKRLKGQDYRLKGNASDGDGVWWEEPEGNDEPNIDSGGENLPLKKKTTGGGGGEKNQGRSYQKNGLMRKITKRGRPFLGSSRKARVWFREEGVYPINLVRGLLIYWLQTNRWVTVRSRQYGSVAKSRDSLVLYQVLAC